MENTAEMTVLSTATEKRYRTDGVKQRTGTSTVFYGSIFFFRQVLHSFWVWSVQTMDHCNLC